MRPGKLCDSCGRYEAVVVLQEGAGPVVCNQCATPAPVHEPYIVCPLCQGRGTQTLHGHAYTADEMWELGPDFIDDYRAGVYDHPCDHCQGKRVTTGSSWDDWQQMRHEQRMGY